MPRPPRWTEEEDSIILLNKHTRLWELKVLLPNRTQQAIKIRRINKFKAIPGQAKENDVVIQSDNIRDHKFNPNKHVILNNSTVGKIPVYIESERLTVYIDDESKRAGVKAKFENRHKF